jgi:hypothetical protein
MQELNHPQLKQFRNAVGAIYTIIPEGFNRFTIVRMNAIANSTNLIIERHISDTDLKDRYDIVVPIELVDYKILDPATPTGIDLIKEERRRVIHEEGFTVDNDKIYEDEQLSFAAATYALPAMVDKTPCFKRIHLWPWSPMWWKPSPDDRIKELKKAGQLIAAEIDRLQSTK